MVMYNGMQKLVSFKVRCMGSHSLQCARKHHHLVSLDLHEESELHPCCLNHRSEGDITHQRSGGQISFLRFRSEYRPPHVGALLECLCETRCMRYDGRHTNETP